MTIYIFILIDTNGDTCDTHIYSLSARYVLNKN